MGSCADRRGPGDRAPLPGAEPAGAVQIQAAINAVHSSAARADATDWRQILQLYDHLLSVAPGPVVALNRAVAVAEVHGPHAALPLVDGLPLDRYYLFHAIRADLLRRLGRTTEAASAYEAAIALSGNATERGSSPTAVTRCSIPDNVEVTSVVASCQLTPWIAGRQPPVMARRSSLKPNA